jgi:hypothetical protein
MLRTMRAISRAYDELPLRFFEWGGKGRAHAVIVNAVVPTVAGVIAWLAVSAYGH